MNITDVYKLWLIRKISNQILENIINYIKTQHIFKDSNNQKFPIIIAKGEINKK